MQIPNQKKLKQKIQFGVLMLLITATMAGCSGGGPSATKNENVAVALKKSAGPRKEVCWKRKSRLKEIEIQRDGKVRRKKLECNLITRRSLALKKSVLALK